MGDFYTEQLVKRQKASSTTLIKAILIILTVLSVVLIFMIPFGIIGPVIMIALDVFLFRSMDVEYEYLFVNGSLDIDKIMAKSRRKNMFSMEMTDLEMMAPSGSPELRPYQKQKKTDCETNIHTGGFSNEYSYHRSSGHPRYSDRSSDRTLFLR